MPRKLAYPGSIAPGAGGVAGGGWSAGGIVGVASTGGGIRSSGSSFGFGGGGGTKRARFGECMSRYMLLQPANASTKASNEANKTGGTE